jgi:hypothetical protein
MTIEEMKNLKLGDVVQDLELLKNLNKEIFCLVAEIQEDRIYCIAVDKKYESRYPHVFRFNDLDRDKLSFPVLNVTETIYSNIIKNHRSIESFYVKAFK